MGHLNTVYSGKLLNDLIPPRIEVKLGKLYCNGCKNMALYTKLINDTYKQFVDELNTNLLNTKERDCRLNYLYRTLFRFTNCRQWAEQWYETVIGGSATDDPIIPDSCLDGSTKVFEGEHTIFGQSSIISKVKKNPREFAKLQDMFKITLETIVISISNIENAITIEEKEFASAKMSEKLLTEIPAPIFKWKGKTSHFGGYLLEFKERGELEYLCSYSKLAERVLAGIEFEKGTTPANLAKELSRNSNSMSAESARKIKEEIDDLLKNSRN